MTRTFAATLCRSNWLLHPAELINASQSIQKAISSFMVDAALAPFAELKSAKCEPRKTAVQKSGHKLGGVLSRLRAADSFMPASVARSIGCEASPHVPSGAQSLARKHRSAAGSRGYTLYLPASRPKRPKGLVLMLHGCNQTPADFAAGTDMNAMAEKHGLAIAYPAQTGGHNGASCWNWFKPGNQLRGAGEPAILASMTRKLMKEFDLDRDSVFVAGLSAGGAMAAILADVYPDIFSAAGIHSGLTRGAARGVVSAVSAMRNGGTSEGRATAVTAPSSPVRRIIFQGDADSTVHPSNASMIVAAAVGGDAVPAKVGKRSIRGRGYARSDFAGTDGTILLELWMINGAGHAWSGGRAAGSYTDNKGPDASAQMIRFFLASSA